ncbi:MAG: UDP-N-acetylmuramate dehydrogenase, partial [Armatimonadetes bacterium]|nr:UDP-N-acetylmuramate dehydrogenase [Armatimonadota bacterium]
MQSQAIDQRGRTAAEPTLAARLARAIEALRQDDALELRLDEPMAPHTSLGVGGAAAVYAVARRVGGVQAAMAAAREHGLPILVVGRGTNLLVRDGGYSGIVLHIGPALSAITIDGDRLCAEAGASLAEVCEAAAEAGLSGLEFAAGVPGSVGGAAAMNAGAGAGQIGDVIESVEVVHEDGTLGTCSREGLEFGYRRSCLRDERCVAVRVVFRLAPADPAPIKRAMFEAVESRCRKQPLSLGSCGSVFKRPPNDYAGRLLEVAGVKGLAIGGARFSTKHANFIVNEGTATAQDVVDL